MKRALVLVATALLVIAGITLVLRNLHSSASAQAPTSLTPSPALRGDSIHPASTQKWLDTRLYFGLGSADSTPAQIAASEATWRDFLDHEVTPRFPAGLSVVDIYGQWQRTPEAVTLRERSKLLILDYPATPENAARVEAIRAAWKQRTHAQSVLRVTQPADVSF